MRRLKNTSILKTFLAWISIATCLHAAATTGGGMLDSDLSDKDSLIRQTTSGRLVGVSQGDHAAWLGIPYAQPPVNALRWKAPRPIKQKQTLLTTKAGSPCSQQKPQWHNDQFGPHFAESTYVGNEDCLYLNVWSPSFSKEPVPKDDQRLPVMVWIHGGGNIWGNGEVAAGRLVASQQVIVVSMTYRLGAFGWLSHPALRDTAETPEDASGNFGTLDIIMALQWVQDNIEAFGGDPDRVTIFGVSAGAWNTYSLLMSPKATGLFHGAIIQSGWPNLISLPRAEHFIDDTEPGHPQSSNELLLALLIKDGVSTSRKTARKTLEGMSSEDIVRFLKSKTYEQIERAYETIAQAQADSYLPHERLYETKLAKHVPESSHSAPKLFSDGYVLSNKNFYPLVKSRQHNAVPLIVGTTRDEATVFQVMNDDLVLQENGKRSIKDAARYQLVNEYFSKLWKALGVDEPLAALSQQQQAPTFAYRFDWAALPDNNGENASQLFGATHGLDTAFIFRAEKLSAHIVDQPFPKEALPLSDAMMSYWAEFAYTGKPNKGRSGKLPEWRVWSNNQDGKTLLLNTDSQGGIRMTDIAFTRETVWQQMQRDPRAKTEAQRCQLYRDLLAHAHTFLSMQALEQGGCQNRALEEHE